MKNKLTLEQRIKNYSEKSKPIEIAKNKVLFMLNDLNSCKKISENNELEQMYHNELFKIFITEIHPAVKHDFKFIFNTTDVPKALEKVMWTFRFSRKEIEEIFNQNKGKNGDLRKLASDTTKYDFVRWHCYSITNNSIFLDDKIFSTKNKCDKIFKGLNIHHIKNNHVDEYDNPFSICLCSVEQHNKFHDKFGKKSKNDLQKMNDDELTEVQKKYIKIINSIDDKKEREKIFLPFIKKVLDINYVEMLNNLVKDI